MARRVDSRRMIGRAFTGTGGRAIELESQASDSTKERLLQLALYLTNDVIANIPSATLRHLWYRRILGIQIAEGAKVFMHVTFSVRGRPKDGRPGISIGRNSVINQHCWIDGRGGLRIGENVNISSSKIMVHVARANLLASYRILLFVGVVMIAVVQQPRADEVHTKTERRDRNGLAEPDRHRPDQARHGLISDEQRNHPLFGNQNRRQGQSN